MMHTRQDLITFLEDISEETDDHFAQAAKLLKQLSSTIEVRDIEIKLYKRMIQELMGV